MYQIELFYSEKMRKIHFLLSFNSLHVVVMLDILGRNNAFSHFARLKPNKTVYMLNICSKPSDPGVLPTFLYGEGDPR